MARLPRLAAQCVVYLLLAAGLGYFSAAPAYRPFPDDTAELRLSFSRAAEHTAECRRLSPEEIAALPPNMRRPMDCPRSRVPVRVQLLLDGELLYEASVPPSGLADDGNSVVYEKFTVAPGRHTLRVRMNDTRAAEGFPHSQEHNFEIAPGEILVVDFDKIENSFVFL
jgi:hypothetical protein